MSNYYELYNGDCLEVMQQLIDKGVKVNAIITDLPYGTTRNKWDNIIPFDKMWKCVKGISNDNTAILFFGQSLFYAKLVLSNEKMFKYDIVWNKILTSGFLNSHKMPLRKHEQIAVFYKKLPTYNPQMTIGVPCHSKGKEKITKNNNYGEFKFINTNESSEKYPVSIIDISKSHSSKMIHPTQKPVALLEYLIKTYTNENDTVLDFTMGSGTTGVACKHLNRKFIGIELDNNYFNIAKERIERE